jgi:hypothetical protein
MRTTVHAPYRLRVTAFHDGTPWIAFDAVEQHLPCFERGFLGIELKPGTTVEEARQLVDLLNDRIQTFSYTS